METNGTDTLWYYYDASGSLTGFELNGTPYFYVKNLQGDIVAITNASGTKVVEYTYDAWGRVRSTTGSLASTVGAKNPYRYRGYRYEKEFGLYYLQSRYYDPFLKRFINADGYVSTGQGVLGNNMFAYCVNNPVNGCDPCGTCFHRRDFWNDCEECGGRTFGQKIKDLWSTINAVQQQQMQHQNEVMSQQVETIKNGINSVHDYVTNTDEQVVLDAKFLAFYKGAPVIKVPGDSSFSFGIIFFGDGCDKNLLKHEYGHTVQLEILGVGEYFSRVVVPSVTCFWITQSFGLSDKFYYSLPWEYLADKLGGAVSLHGYESWADAASYIYWYYD